MPTEAACPMGEVAESNAHAQEEWARQCMLRVSWPLFNFYLFCACVPAFAYTCHSIPVDVRGQLCEVSFLLPRISPRDQTQIKYKPFRWPLGYHFCDPKSLCVTANSHPGFPLLLPVTAACCCPERPGDGCQTLP